MFATAFTNRILYYTIMVTAGAALGACSILESVPLDAGDPVTCRAAAGIYCLPKKEVKVTVLQASDANGGAFQLDLSDNGSVPDRDFPFCLDFVGSAAADDHVTVERTNGLLDKVHANASDKSLAIAESLVNTGLVAVTGDPNAALRAARFKSGEKTAVADFIFDPLDRARLAEINETLTLYGYCVFIEDHTFVPLSDAQIKRYCDKPTGYRSEMASKAPVLKAPRGGILPSYGGIAYRTNITRGVFIVRKRDPGESSWRLHASQLIEMPNESPIFSIGVDRSAFVTRDTSLEFDKGVLTNVTISKPSEALAAAAFTLRLAQTLIDVPAQIIRVRVQAVNNRKALIDAQNQLIYTQAQYNMALQTVRSGGVATAGALAAGDRAGALRAASMAPTQGVDPAAGQIISDTCNLKPNFEACMKAAKVCLTAIDVQACISQTVTQ